MVTVKVIQGRGYGRNAFLKKEGIINPTVSVPAIRTFETELVPFTNEQLKEIYDACLMYKTFSRHRDYIIMRVMEETGMRISEVLRLTSADINLEQGTIRVSQTKNKKARVVYYTPCLRSELVEYIDARKKFLAENNISTHMLFFCTRANGRSKPGDSLSMRAIEQNIAYYGEYAGVSEVRVSPHTFRHTFARNFLVNGGDIFTLQQILGHSSLEMVRRYVKLFSSDVQSKYLDVMKRYTKSFGRRKKR